VDRQFKDPYIHLTSRLWPILTLVTLLLQILWPSRSWVILLILLGGGWTISYFWARSLARGLRIGREMRYGWAQVGDQLEERFRLVNNGLAPGTWVEVTDQSNLPDYQGGRITAIGGYSSLQWKTEHTCTRRGLYTLGPTCLRTGDPFHIYTIEYTLPDSTVLMVMPPVVPLPSIQIAPGGRIGEGRRARHQSLETTVSVDGVREYVAGEPLKAIHWPTSARRDELFIRQFEHTPASDWWIFLDLDPACQVGHGFDSTEEHGVILAASLAHKGLQERQAVGLTVNSEPPIWLPPGRSASQRMDILRALALAKPGNYPLKQLIESQRASLRKGASLIVVTPNTNPEWLDSLPPLLKLGISPTILLFDPTSFGGSGEVAPLTSRLLELGIACQLISRDLLDRPEARPGSQGAWEWKILGPGKAIPVRKPADLQWRRLR
jgi:uncharacterized protein (DUF58 family)